VTTLSWPDAGQSQPPRRCAPPLPGKEGKALSPSREGGAPARPAGRWSRLAAILLLGGLAALIGSHPALAHKPGKDARLPKIGAAPDFTLTNQDSNSFSLRDTRGKVTVVTFIFTTCSDTCPMLTAKLVGIQRKLGSDAPEVMFAAITVDPLNDTPPVLKRYAQAHSADTARFSFLTGSLNEIEEVTRRYAIYQKKQPGGSVDHTFLTSIVDRGGTLRVQYLGVRFKPEEFLADLRSVLQETSAR
jgi:protein SCO1/2